MLPTLLDSFADPKKPEFYFMGSNPGLKAKIDQILALN